MAVVTKYGTGYKDPAATKTIDATLAEARVMNVSSQIAIANGDSIASQYFVGRLPSNAIILPQSRIDYSALTGVTSMDFGFAGAVNALIAAKDVTAASNASAVLAVTPANLNKRVWELAGLASDPGGMIDVFATLNAAAGAAGVVNFNIVYARR